MSYDSVCRKCKKDKLVLHFNQLCNKCWIEEGTEEVVDE